MDKSIVKLNDNLQCEEPLCQCLRARMEATSNLERRMLLDSNISINQVQHICMLSKTWHTTHKVERKNDVSF
jgi:hypothetical protein